MRLNESDKTGQQPVIAVSELNHAAAQVLARAFPQLWVSGEISNFTQAASGHCYFSLKDRNAQVRSVMFRSRARALAFTPRNGLKVDVLAAVSLYEARGDFQLNVEAMREAGAGDLHQQFLQLKAKLQNEGLFEQEIKRDLPRLPRTIAVVTSLQAAALHDVLSTLAARAPNVPVVIVPTPVQGEDAPAKIVKALRDAAGIESVDVTILVRGGGSLEDLWAFNHESIARAIRASTVPVIVGVGHESDVTIADFAADLRAPTPTGAATMVAPEREALLESVEFLLMRLRLGLTRHHDVLEQRLDIAVRLLPSPAMQWKLWQGRLGELSGRLLAQAAQANLVAQSRVELAQSRLRLPDIASSSRRVEHLLERMCLQTQAQFNRVNSRLQSNAEQLALVSPNAVLARGYALVNAADGRLIKNSRDVAPGQQIDVTLAAGKLKARVTDCDANESET